MIAYLGLILRISVGCLQKHIARIQRREILFLKLGISSFPFTVLSNSSVREQFTDEYDSQIFMQRFNWWSCTWITHHTVRLMENFAKLSEIFWCSSTAKTNLLRVYGRSLKFFFLLLTIIISLLGMVKTILTFNVALSVRVTNVAQNNIVFHCYASQSNW